MFQSLLKHCGFVSVLSVCFCRYVCLPGVRLSYACLYVEDILFELSPSEPILGGYNIGYNYKIHLKKRFLSLNCAFKSIIIAGIMYSYPIGTNTKAFPVEALSV